MNWDTTVIAGGVPLGVFISAVLSFLKGRFGLSGEQARNIVAFAGLIYAVATGVVKGFTQPLPDAGAYLEIVANALVSGVTLIFGAEGFYQWVQKMEKEAK